MRIAHVINNLCYGGAETRVLSSASEAARLGHEVFVITLDAQGPLRSQFGEVCTVIDLRARPLANVAAAGARLFNLLNRILPDVVNTHLVLSGLVGRLAARSLGTCSIVSTQHNAYYPKQNSYLYRLERKTWSVSEGMIAISNATSQYLRKFDYRGPICVIPTGIGHMDAVDRSHSMAKPYLLSVGHFRDYQKGHDTLITAFSKIAADYPELRLVIAGDGPLRPAMEQLAQTLDIASRVDFVGLSSEVTALMRHCEIFVLPSRWEGFGRVIIEAMAAGAPVIASRVEAIPEIVTHDVTGLLTQPEDVDDVANAILALLREPRRRRRLTRQAAREVVARHSIADMVNRELAFYRSLIGRNASLPPALS